MRLQKRHFAYLEIGLVILIWGIATVVIKATLNGISPLPFLTYRFFLSTLIAIPFLPSLVKLLKNSKNRSLIVFYALLSAPVGLGVLFLGLNKTSVVNLSFIQAVEPILLVYLGAHFFHDHLSKRGKIGVFIAIFGVFLTLIEPLFQVSDGGTFTGNILIVVFVLIDMLSILILKKLLRKNISAFHLTNLSFVFGFVSFVFIAFLTDSPRGVLQTVVNLPIKYQLGVWYMAILSGTVAYTLRSRAQKTLTVTETSIFGYLSPVISTVLAIMFLGEKITSLFLIGAVLIVIGVVLVEYRRKL